MFVRVASCIRGVIDKCKGNPRCRKAIYFEVTGQTRYGTLKELADRKLIPDKLADGEDESFLFVLTTGENHYELTAKPVGIYAASVYVDETGVIRESENTNTIANRSSLPIKIQE
jgi:hypothetical protein